MAIGKKVTEPDRGSVDWTFLTNHSHVLICLAADPDALMRDVALAVGITERAVQKIVSDLEDEGYLVRERDGRRNHYRVKLAGYLRHPMENHVSIGALIKALKPRGR